MGNLLKNQPGARLPVLPLVLINKCTDYDEKNLDVFKSLD
jgi:hypothetical protein